MNPSTPGLPVHHQLLEFTQTHIHRVSDAIQPSHPLSSPSPPAPIPRTSGSFQMSQFSSGGQSIGVSTSASVLPMNIQDWFPLGWTGWISSTPQFKSIRSSESHQVDTRWRQQAEPSQLPTNCGLIFEAKTRTRHQLLQVLPQELAFVLSERGNQILLPANHPSQPQSELLGGEIRGTRLLPPCPHDTPHPTLQILPSQVRCAPILWRSPNLPVGGQPVLFSPQKQLG